MRTNKIWKGIYISDTERISRTAVTLSALCGKKKEKKKGSYDYDDSIKMLPRLLTTVKMAIIMNGCV